MFLWERSPTITPKPMEFPMGTMEEVVFQDGSKGTKPSNTYKSRAWRWLNAKQATNKSLEKVIDKEDGFLMGSQRLYFSEKLLRRHA